jgi:hypothetical protein
MHCVLGITELLEKILENLQYGDLLLSAMPTSRFWKECIGGSVKLRRICFQIPEFEAAEEKHAGEPDSPEISRRHDPETGRHLARLSQNEQWEPTPTVALMEPWLAASVNTFFASTNEDSIRISSCQKALDNGQISILDHVKCNFLLKYFSDLEDPGYTSPIRNWRFERIKAHKTCKDIIWGVTPFGLAIFKDKIKYNSPFDIQHKLLAHLKHLQGTNTTASWATHQLTRPASTEIYLLQDYTLNTSPLFPGRIIKNEKGITVGQLISTWVEILKMDIESYSDQDWAAFYRIYFETSYTIIDGLMLGPDVDRLRNIQIYRAKVVEQSEELQRVVRTIL